MRPPAPAGGPTHTFLLSLTRHWPTGGGWCLIQTFFTSSLPRRSGGGGPRKGGLIGDGRLVAFALPPRITAVLFIPRPPGTHCS